MYSSEHNAESEGFALFEDDKLEEHNYNNNSINNFSSIEDKPEAWSEFYETDQEFPLAYNLENKTGDKEQQFSTCYIRYRTENDCKTYKTWQCNICNRQFAHQYTLTRHLSIHTGERRFECTICGKAFRQMSTLSQHKAIHSTERPFTCVMCLKTFNRVSTLISHRKIHSMVKAHKCHLCDKSFHQKGNLRNHIFTHTNERPYKCNACDKGFNQMSNLMFHKSRAHPELGEQKYVCQVCNQGFLRRCDCIKHIKSVHEMIEAKHENILQTNANTYNKNDEGVNFFVEEPQEMPGGKSSLVFMPCTPSEMAFLEVRRSGADNSYTLAKPDGFVDFMKPENQFSVFPIYDQQQKENDESFEKMRFPVMMPSMPNVQVHENDRYWF